MESLAEIEPILATLRELLACSKVSEVLALTACHPVLASAEADRLLTELAALSREEKGDAGEPFARVAERQRDILRPIGELARVTGKNPAQVARELLEAWEPIERLEEERPGRPS